jgi:hypothetical protein
MNHEEIKQLDLEQRKQAILDSLGELTQRRDDLEKQIRELCCLWDETVAELDREQAAKQDRFSEPATTTSSQL